MQLSKVHDVDTKIDPVSTPQQQGNPPSDAGLSIVIPTYNAIGTVEPLLEQLAALPEFQRGEYEVILTDDASTDDTVEKLRQRYPQFSYVGHAENTGFGANCNRGIALASKGYTALVNTDIELVGNPFPLLIEALSRQPHYFALMPLVYNVARQQVENLQRLIVKRALPWNEDLPLHEDFSGVIAANFESGVARDDLMRGVKPDTSQPGGIVNTILCGACFVCLTDKLKKLGGFDTAFAPFYWEDVDLGERALRSPYPSSTGTLTTCLVLHRHSESINAAHGARKMHFLRMNQLRYALKHLRPPGTDEVPYGRFDRGQSNGARWYLHGIAFRLWLNLRGLRENFGGDAVLRDAYFKAGAGANEV